MEMGVTGAFWAEKRKSLTDALSGALCDRPLTSLSQLPDQRSAGAAMEERGQRQDGQDGEGPGHGWGRAAGSSRGERAGSTAADSEGPWPPQRWRCVLRCLTARGPSTFAARRLLQPGAS